MLSNRSAFVDSANSPLRIAASDIPLPGANDIIVRNHAVAINTIDPAQQGGFQVKTWPIVPGHDLAPVMAARQEYLGDHLAASTLVVVAALVRPEWKVETAVIAARPR